MGNLSRVMPFVWPYRRRLMMSAGFALLVALLWTANLSTIGPMVRVLLQEDGLHGWIETTIADAQQEIKACTASLEAANAPDREKRARLEARLTEAHQSLATALRLRDNVIRFLPRDKFRMVAIILGLLLFATLIKGACMFAQDVLVGTVVQRATLDIRRTGFRRLLKLDYQSLATTGSSEMLSRLTNDVEQLAQGMRVMGIRVVREPLKALTCVTGAFLVNWRLTLLTLLVVPAIAFVFHRFGRALKRASRASMEAMAGIYQCLGETFDRIRVVLAFNGQRRHRQQFHRVGKTYYSRAMHAIRISALTSPTTEILGLVAVFAATLPAVYLVLRGKTGVWGIRLAAAPMGLAELTMLYSLLAGTLDPIRKLSSVYGKVKRASAAADRIFALMDMPASVTDPPHPLLLPRHREGIRFDKISFHYDNQRGDQAAGLALRDVSLHVEAGEVVAVLGENGCGKSTLVSLLPRYFDPTAGQVEIDGVNLREVKLRDLRRQIGVVTQETLLFDDTVSENIRYGLPEATASDIEQAARRAHVTAFLDHLPQGLQTNVGANGSRLSGGQRQRIALARAMLRDPAILILDEATSAVDAQSELLIHKSLAEFIPGRTVFIISHALNATLLDLVTRIVVMDAGRIVATGCHDSLMASCPVYQRLYRSQTARRAG